MNYVIGYVYPYRWCELYSLHIKTWALAHFGLSNVDSVIHNLSNSMNFCGKE